jgi:hypothetical protein
MLLTRKKPANRDFLLPANALTAGMSLFTGQDILDVEIVSDPAVADRSAGRWCDQCNEHGSHHSDRHALFFTVRVTAYYGSADPVDDVHRQAQSKTVVFDFDEMVSLTDFPATAVPAANHALAVPADLGALPAAT